MTVSYLLLKPAFNFSETLGSFWYFHPRLKKIPQNLIESSLKNKTINTQKTFSVWFKHEEIITEWVMF